MGPRLRIGIDADVIGRRRTGNERFVRNLIPALRRASDHELVVYVSAPPADPSFSELDRTHLRVLRPSHALPRLLATLPWRAKRDRLDVLLVQYTAPPLAPCPVVTVVHDVAFALFPE